MIVKFNTLDRAVIVIDSRLDIGGVRLDIVEAGVNKTVRQLEQERTVNRPAVLFLAEKSLFLNCKRRNVVIL